MIGNIALAFLRPLWKLLTFVIAIPIWLILIVGLWLYFDKSSDIRKAVDDAVKELVAGAELEAASAKIDALERIAAENKRLADRLEKANRALDTEMLNTNRELENANADIEKLLSRPDRIRCDLDDDLYNGLRSK